tara:strand:- start:493 stop:723 length:231 start_codon:yes stop_codon:yes gene_type:complete
MSEEFSNILQKLESMEKKINNLETQTQKMSNHIDFINDVYSKISSPLWWICEKVNNLKGGKSLENNTSASIECKDY